MIPESSALGQQWSLEASGAGVLPADRESHPEVEVGGCGVDRQATATRPNTACHARPTLWVGDPHLPQATLQTAEPARSLGYAAPAAAAELSLLRGGPELGSTSSSNSRGASRDPEQ